MNTTYKGRTGVRVNTLEGTTKLWRVETFEHNIQYIYNKMDAGNNHDFYTFPDYAGAVKHFFSLYEYCNLVVTPDKPQPALKPKDQRACRFCGTTGNASAFKSDSHLIPEMLGNKYLFADFECDKCNSEFSQYEDDLAYSLGIFRTIFSVKGKRGVPTFKSMSNTLRADEEDFYGLKAITVKETTEQVKSFKFDKETGKCSIEYKKHGYVPINLYKILFKIALSTLPEQNAKNYQRAYRFILSKEKLDWVAGMCNVVYFDLPLEFRVSRPICFLFKKKDKDLLLPTHFFVFRVFHMVFQFPLHYHQEDIASGLYQAGHVDLPFCPPLLLHPPSTPNCYNEVRDLSSNEKVYEEQHIGFDFDPEHLTKLGAMNPQTGEVTDAEFKPEEIVKMVFYHGNEIPNFPRFDRNKDQLGVNPASGEL